MPYYIDPNNPPLIKQGTNSPKYVSTYEIKNEDESAPAFLRILNADQQELIFSVSISPDPEKGWYPVITGMHACRTEVFILPPKHYAQITVLVAGNDNPDHAYTIPIQTEAYQLKSTEVYVIEKSGISQGY